MKRWREGRDDVDLFFRLEFDGRVYLWEVYRLPLNIKGEQLEKYKKYRTATMLEF